MSWYLKVVTQDYMNFSGRARRTEYWMFALIHYLILFVLYFLMMVSVDLHSGFPIFMILYALYLLATFIPSFSVTVRRLHDIGRSGAWVLLIFVPFGGLVLLYFTILDSQFGENEYGPNPKEILLD